MKKLLDVEVVPGGVQKAWLHTGGDNRDKLTFETVVDVEPILKANAEEFNSAPTTFKGDMHKVAEIPQIVLEDMARKHGIPFGELLLGRSDKAKHIMHELLNGREFRAFRTKPGFLDVNRGR